MRRLLVTQTPARADAPGSLAGPLPVGALHWLAPEPMLTVVVKATCSFATDDLAFIADQAPIGAAMVSPEGIAPDLVPFKPRLDLLVAGHAYAVGAPADALEIALRAGTIERRLHARSATRTDRIPLVSTHLWTPDGARATTMGPRGAPADRPRFHEPGFDFGIYAAAPREQQGEPLAADDEVELVGLSARGPRRLRLPSWVPFAIVVFERGDLVQAPLVLDTLALDVDRDVATLDFRGLVALREHDSVEMLIVTLEPAREPRSIHAIRAALARGWFGFAATETSPSPDPEPGTDEPERVERARWEARAAEEPAEPGMPLETYARISAELAEKREPRADVLARHGLDEGAYFVEERAWLQAIARLAMDGDATLAARYGELFVQAQDALATPEEEASTMADYARLTVALESADEPHRVLETHGLALAAWMRLDRRFQRELARDPAEEARFEALCAAERMKAGGDPG